MVRPGSGGVKIIYGEKTECNRKVIIDLIRSERGRSSGTWGNTGSSPGKYRKSQGDFTVEESLRENRCNPSKVKQCQILMNIYIHKERTDRKGCSYIRGTPSL